MSGSDPSQRLSSATGVLRSGSSDASFEADFADLAARFAAQSGGGLSPELSADLALEIVLNEVVDQACTATGATGAAIVLRRDGQMVCRARSGATAPQLGSRLDATSGVSGECVRTLRTQVCDDVLADPRADLAASQRLGVRSLMVMPLLCREQHEEELAGVFELFSSLPSAFGERDERTLEALAARILTILRKTAPAPPPEPAPVAEMPLPVEPMRFAESAPVAEPLPAADAPPTSDPLLASELHQEPILQFAEDVSRRGFDFVTVGLRAAVLICAVLLALLLGRHLGFQRTALRARPAAPISHPNVPVETPALGASGAETELNPAAQSLPVQSSPVPTAPPRTGGDAVPPGSLRVFENGKEVFRQSPAQSVAEPDAESPSPEQGSGMQRAASSESEKVVRLSPAAAEGSLLQRVEPEYPEQARQQRIQGQVVLDVRIGADGAVQDIQWVSGPPQLAQASTDAVLQWRFQPRRVNGRPVEMQTRVTLNFRLPQ